MKGYINIAVAIVVMVFCAFATLAVTQEQESTKPWSAKIGNDPKKTISFSFAEGSATDTDAMKIANHLVQKARDWNKDAPNCGARVLLTVKTRGSLVQIHLKVTREIRNENGDLTAEKIQDSGTGFFKGEEGPNYDRDLKTAVDRLISFLTC